MTVVASNYARKENDIYQTEPWATEALLRHFPVSGLAVWEPAAGNHLIADVLLEAAADRRADTRMELEIMSIHLTPEQREAAKTRATQRLMRVVGRAG